MWNWVVLICVSISDENTPDILLCVIWLWYVNISIVTVTLRNYICTKYFYNGGSGSIRKPTKKDLSVWNIFFRIISFSPKCPGTGLWRKRTFCMFCFHNHWKIMWSHNISMRYSKIFLSEVGTRRVHHLYMWHILFVVKTQPNINSGGWMKRKYD